MSIVGKVFKPKYMTIRRSFLMYGDAQLYNLRLSDGKTFYNNDDSKAVMEFTGTKKYISKVFHEILKEFALPPDRLDWNRIDMGKMRWDFRSK